MAVPGLRIARTFSPVMLGGSSLVVKFGYTRPMSPAHMLGGSSVSAGLRLRFKPTPVFLGGGGLDAYFSYAIPVPAAAGPDDLPGTVNFVRNSSLESAAVGVTDWSMSGGTVTRITSDAWHGAACAQAVYNNGATNARLQIVTQGGLALKPAGKVVGSIRLKNAVGPFDCWVSCVYSDASSDVSDTLSVTPGSDWTWVKFPSLTPNPAKTVDRFYLNIQRTGVGSGAITLLADAAQVEQDRGFGASTFAYGGYTDGFHSWARQVDLSVAVRQPIPMILAGSGVGGVIVVDAALYRATYDNQWLEDLSDYVVKATVTADATRDVTWALTADLLWDGWTKLTPYQDWVAPVLTVTYPDGTVSSGQLGLYMVMDSPADRSEVGPIVHLDARDPLWLLSAQGFTGPVVVRAGTDKMQAARTLLDSAVLTADANGKPRYRVPDAGTNLGHDKEWTRDTSRLALVNELARGGGCYPLWTVGSGVIHTRKRGKDRLRHREPVRVWAANVPQGELVDVRVPRVSNLPSEVVGVIQRTAKAGDQTNEIVLVSDDPHGRTHVRHKVTHPNNPRATWWAAGRKHVRKIHHPVVDDDDTARDIAAAMMEELSTRDSTITLGVLPDPAANLLRETVACAIWDAAGNPVAVGQYAVLNVSYGFTPDDAVMKVELGYIDDIDNLLEQTVSVGTSSTQIVAANSGRRRIEIENRSASVVWLSVDGSAVVNVGDALVPGQTLIYPSTAAIAGIVNAGTATLAIVEV
jgi:hypothetical protein